MFINFRTAVFFTFTLLFLFSGPVHGKTCSDYKASCVMLSTIITSINIQNNLIDLTPQEGEKIKIQRTQFTNDQWKDFVMSATIVSNVISKEKVTYSRWYEATWQIGSESVMLIFHHFRIEGVDIFATTVGQTTTVDGKVVKLKKHKDTNSCGETGKIIKKVDIDGVMVNVTLQNGETLSMRIKPGYQSNLQTQYPALQIAVNDFDLKMWLSKKGDEWKIAKTRCSWGFIFDKS